MFLRGAPIDIAFFDRVPFWSKTERDWLTGCLVWQQSTASHGYGQTWDGVTVRLAHRVAWALHHGEQIPDGMTVDHICRNRRCVEPSHLRLLSNVDNARDNGFAGRTHCPQGHPYDEANTYIQPRTGGRRCRACARERRQRMAA